jgi:hypothetical protein
LHEAYTLAEKRLTAVGESLDQIDRGFSFGLFGEAVTEIARHVEATARLSSLVSDFMASKNYQSGLEKNFRLAEDMQAIFRQHTASALLDLSPISLNDLILQVVGERFGPYGKIRGIVRDLEGDPSRGHSSLASSLSRIEEAGEVLKEAKTHKTWRDFGGLGGLGLRGDNGIKDRESMDQRISDLERFLGPFGTARRWTSRADSKGWRRLSR